MGQHQTLKIITRFALIGVLMLLTLIPSGQSGQDSFSRYQPLDQGAETVQALQRDSRHIGYGISVAPWLESRPDLLNQMGMDWVLLYSTDQLGDYPDQHVLYRIDFEPNKENMNDWLNGLPGLITVLSSAGVDAVQLGNEPNLQFEWGGHTMDPRYFTSLLCQGYHAVKSTNPDMIVVAAGMASTVNSGEYGAISDLDFTQTMLNYGGGECFDAFGYHPYGYNQPPEADPNTHQLVFRRAELMNKLLWNNGVRDKQMWLTEFGWIRDPGEDGLNCTGHPDFWMFEWMTVSRYTQADYTARAFRFAESNWPWVGPMFLWNLNWSLYDTRDGFDACNQMRWFSVLDRNNEPLPVINSVGQVEKRPPQEYRPTVGALVQGLTRTAEAGCAGHMRLGSFVVLNSGYPGHLDVKIEPANGPNRPEVWTSTTEAVSGTEVEVFVDASGMEPGLHMVAVNLTAEGTSRISAYVVRGWLLIHYPTTPDCVARYGK